MKVFSNVIDVEAVFLSFFFLGACILLLFLPMFELLFEGFPRGFRRGFRGVSEGFPRVSEGFRNFAHCPHSRNRRF